MDPTQIYNEFKTLSFSGGYFLCEPGPLAGQEWTFNAIVVPPLGGFARIGMFCDDRRVSHRSLNPTGGLEHVQGRLGPGRTGALAITFQVATRRRRTVVIECRDLDSGSRIGAPYHVPPREALARSDPDAAGMLRAVRSAEVIHYAFNGFDDCQKLSALFRRYATNPESPLKVLDWGVGSGRVSRYMQGDAGIELYGTDIDPVNLETLWASGYPRKRFRRTEPEGPIPFESATFDAVFGISVFTHLSERLQDFYLQELHRVLKPGGTGIFSVHGFLHFFTRINDGDLFFRWMDRGFLVVGDNLDLRSGFGASTDRKLYVDVLHTPLYIQSRWGEVFPQITIIAAPNAYGHDLVVCRKA